jgi:adenylate cyclase
MPDRETVTPSELPFPLRRRFRRRIVPGLIGVMVVSVALSWAAANGMLKAVYLELAQHRAEGIAAGVAAAAPEAWNGLISGGGASSPVLREAFAHEAGEFKLTRLKVYDLERRVLYATRAEDIGKIERGAALAGVIEEGQAHIVATSDPDGSQLYELYVPLLDSRGRLRAVFELYEPIGYLDAILLRGAVPAVAVPAVLLLVLTAALWHLVGRAQVDIDQRTASLNALRRRLETFVSASAADAARGADAGGRIPSRTVRCALLYSDIRDFSGFAEGNAPEHVVSFLNDLMAVQVAAVREHGGDVDKMIGDAVLAWFEGADGGARAISAAKDILGHLARSPRARGVGIGVFTGEAISGAVGPAERRDFTLIGDSVNIAARLCSAAAAGELVADADTVADAGGFGAIEAIRVKGRQGSLSIRRWSA